MNPVWRFKSVEWNENGTNVELTISGKQFAKLMDLCFEQADTFSFCAARWANAKDRRLENALKGFKTGEIHTNHWFCYGITHPDLKVDLYRAADEAKEIILQYIEDLFLSGDENNLYTLEDLCFFKGDELFLGTVTHERMCYAHILSKQFGEELRRLGDWEDGSDNNFARLDLSCFEKVDEP